MIYNRARHLKKFIFQGHPMQMGGKCEGKTIQFFICSLNGNRVLHPKRVKKLLIQEIMYFILNGMCRTSGTRNNNLTLVLLQTPESKT